MSAQLVLMHLFNGLILGSIYVLLSLGLSIIFGMLGIINFAHGAFYMLGAYCAYTLTTYLAFDSWTSLVLTPIILGLLGAGCEFILFRRLYKLPPLYIMLFTFGLMLVLQDIVRMIFGGVGVPYGTPELLVGTMNIGFMYYPKYRLFIIIVSAACSFSIWLFLSKTKLGAIIRAATDNSIMVDALGINIGRIICFSFALGIALAGLAGVLAAPMRNVTHVMGMDFLIDCFVVVVIGGMGSISGSIVAGLMVGEIIALGVMVWPPMAHSLIYFFMAAFLLLRPRGLFGREAFHD
jgi:branched-chain amino acid transport system permease protein